ncbi:diguanylate cyclase [Vibrio sp. TH_r3]|uniref:diguanylate cyclase domain-containing protein n=1 Tax=Vibrio sp. TH_r3 TaxID=3082084 RepID=UPI00295488B3|nr:diguanylate cyclase [Vibrio sp. TH_r3]MDV7103808.1 diguanylate cyclase [Vibrio sp. TH_r3]
MNLEQAYFCSVALVNLVFAFAGTQIKKIDKSSRSIIYFVVSFFANFVSWFIYVFEVTELLEILSAITSTTFIWGMVLFACSRTLTQTPWAIIAACFSLNCAAQLYFITQGTLIQYLHISSLFVPIAFWSISFMFLKLKKNRHPSDYIIAYTYVLMAFVIIGRSVLMEASPEIFARSSMYSQIIWPAFSAIIGVFVLLSYTEEAQTKLKIESNTDQLTNIYNRRKFDTKLKELVEDLATTNQFGALIYLDLDGFKPINDQYGHYIGDKVLIELADRLNKLCRNDDTVARLGGDEFAVLATNVSGPIDNAKLTTKQIAIKIQNVIKQPIVTHGLTLQVDCSIGVHVIQADLHSAHSVLLAADNAMYNSKNVKRGSITFSDEYSNAKYSLLTIGIDEIDQDHQKIDQMIQSMVDAPQNIKTEIPKLIELVRQHFQNEVNVSKQFKLNMTAEHIEQHKTILQQLELCLPQDDESIVLASLTEIYKRIENHALQFDSTLNKK